MYFRHPIPKTYSTMEDEKEVKGVGGASAEHHLEKGPHTALSIGKHRTRGLKRTQAHLRRFGGVWTAVVASDDRSVRSRRQQVPTWRRRETAFDREL